MQKSSKAETRGSLLPIFVLALVTALVIVPFQFITEAGSQNEQGLVQQTTVNEEGLEYFDIRTDKASRGTIEEFRRASGNDAVAANIRSKFGDAEADLRLRIPTLKVEYNPIFRVPELIAPDIMQGPAFMTGPSGEKRSAILRNFAKTNSELIGMGDEQIDQLKVTADYTNPDGNLSFASLEQFVRGVPVFRGEIKAGFTKRGEMYRVVNNLASGLDYGSLSSDFGDPAEAVRVAATDVRAEVDMTPNAAESTDLKAVFGSGYYPTTASKYYFPIETGLARASWYVIVWKPVNAYEMIIDAETGKVLWRQNMAKDQTQSVTYNVWSNSTSAMNTMDSPAPLSPGPIDPALGTQGVLQPRTNVTLIGNEAPNTFNNNGWMNDGTNSLEGNNVQAGLDRATPNGPDTPLITGSSNRVFDFASNPPPGNPAPGDAPLPAGQTPTPCQAAPPVVNDFQRASVTQMFYALNRMHDYLYLRGFTEQARNFQLDNFGRGGTGNDRVLAEGQDCAGVNNANFASSSTDGTVGRMQMFLWTPPAVDRDGTMDVDIIVHEVGHGITNRLHTGGISGTQGGQMHEGNGDFLAHTLLAESADPINGVYSMGGYATLNLRAAFGGQANYYWGIRRFPKAVIAFTGGPANQPHNPLTYADIDPAQHNVTNGAFAPAFTGSATAPHDGGEIWSSMLWEVRSRLVSRLGHTDGTAKSVQLMFDGMKLAVSTSTMINSRNSMLAAAQASGTGADIGDVWAGFAARGLGFSAANPTGNTVVEGFDLPNLVQTPTFTVSDAGGDGDGFPEPGEPLVLTVPLTNNTGGTATGVTLQVVGGGSANYGTINHGQTVSQQVSFTVPAAAPCGSSLSLTFNLNSSLGATTFTRSIVLGEPVITFSENFDGVTAPNLPAGWTAVPVLGTLNFATVTTNADTPPNSVFAVDPAAGASGTDLTSPPIAITAPGASLSFRHRFDTEAAWDGGVVEISIGAGPFADIITAGGTFVTNGYNSQMTAAAPSPTYTPNPLNGRNGWTGVSGGFITTTITLPPSAAGQNVRFKWRFGADDNTTGTGPNPGWNVDTVNLIGNYQCTVTGSDARADFDGDGRTDISVYRPSDGNWYLNRSTDGFTVVGFGAATDLLTPGDYDGDGKTDVAVWRPSTGFWHVVKSTGGFITVPFGAVGDIPVAGDYDGDGKTDFAVFRPSTGEWHIQRSTGGTTTTVFGVASDKLVRADYDGDGETDIAIYRDGQWWISRSTGGVTVTSFGVASDKPVPADYDGDGKEDIAVYRPTDGTWYILRSLDGGVSFVPFGVSTDIPVPGDYDGDGKSDQAVYRDGTWYLNRSTSGFGAVPFGVATDKAVLTAYIP